MQRRVPLLGLIDRKMNNDRPGIERQAMDEKRPGIEYPTTNDGRPWRERPTSEQIEKEMGRLWLRRETLKVVWGAVRTLLIFAAAAVLLSMLLFPVIRVQMGSMNPTLEDGQILIFASFGKIKRGDIIAFHYNNQVLIKRVVAVEYETVDVKEDGTVFVDNAPTYEPYVQDPAAGECTTELPARVPYNQYFVMGDHRATSIDSRRAEIGMIDQSQVVGRVVFRLWPPGRP